MTERAGARRRRARGSPVRPVRRPHPRLVVDVVTAARVDVRALGPWLAAVAPTASRGQVTVAVVGDRRVRRLNAAFRGKDATTDVLSFPADAPGLLGDIVIAAGVARRQARRAGHPLRDELRVLALHGLLHLLGHDHETDDGAMARLEARLRRKGGLAAGLIEREASCDH